MIDGDVWEVRKRRKNRGAVEGLDVDLGSCLGLRFGLVGVFWNSKYEALPQTQTFLPINHSSSLRGSLRVIQFRRLAVTPRSSSSSLPWAYLTLDGIVIPREQRDGGY